MRKLKNHFLNKKYLSLKSFYILKNDFKIIFEYLDNNNIKLENKKIIDIACGNASFTNFMKKKYPNNKYFGLDKDRKLIALNRKNNSLKDVKFYCQSCENKISNKKIDLITLLGTLVFFKNQKKIINNLLKNLNKGGILIINAYLNNNNIDIDIKYRKFFNKKTFLKNSIFIKSFQDTKNFLKKKTSKLVIKKNNIPFKIKRSKNNMNIYTSKLNGHLVRTSDLNIIYDQFLIIAKK